jgi:hypothetical protein
MGSRPERICHVPARCHNNINEDQAMPILVGLTVIIQACFAYHALKTGRPYWWIFLIMGMPVMGCLLYFFIEVFPNTRESAKAERAIGQAIRNVGKAMDPQKELREKLAEAELNPSIDNKLSLARECRANGMAADAVTVLKTCLSGAYADDPHVKLELLESMVAANTHEEAVPLADELLNTHAGYKTAQVQLARAQALEATEQFGAAEEAYRDAMDKGVGEEARGRFAQLLANQGQTSRARDLWEETVKNADRLAKTNAHYKEQNAAWIRAAKEALAKVA